MAAISETSSIAILWSSALGRSTAPVASSAVSGHLRDELTRELIGTHRDELPELDERRTELLERDPPLAREYRAAPR
jgi:hypothetical protein